MFIEGMDAMVKCPAFFGDPPGHMIWTVGDFTITDNRFILEDGQMIIQNIQDIDGGVYRCSIIYLLAIVDSRFITVAVLKRSGIASRIVQPMSPIIIVLNGDPLDLMCLLETPINNVDYTWTVDSDFDDNSMFQRATSSLHIEGYHFLGGQ